MRFCFFIIEFQVFLGHIGKPLSFVKNIFKKVNFVKQILLRIKDLISCIKSIETRYMEGNLYIPNFGYK